MSRWRLRDALRRRWVWPIAIAAVVYLSDRMIDLAISAPGTSRAWHLTLDATTDAILLVGFCLVAIRQGLRWRRRIERFYRLLMESSTDLVFLLGNDGRILHLNELAGRVLGCGAADGIGRLLPELLPVGATQRIGAVLDHVLRTGETFVAPAEPLGVSGLWVETTIEPIVDEPGLPPKALCRCRDVTAQHAAAERGMLLAQELEGLVESSPIAHLVVDMRRRRITGCNPAFRACLGWSAEEIGDIDNWWALVCPNPGYRREVRRDWESEVRRAADTNRSAGPLLARLACRDGSERLCEMRAPGRGDLRLVTFTDLTARLQTEAALRESEQRYRTILAALAEGLVILDDATRIVASNLCAEQILGVDVGSMLGRKPDEIELFSMIRRADGSVFSLDSLPMMTTLRTGTPCSGVVMGLEDRGGGTTWISANAVALPPSEGRSRGVVLSFRDITEHMRLVAALEQASHEWRRTFDALDSAVIILNDAGAVLQLNRAAAAKLGRDPSDCAGVVLSAMGREEPWQTAASLLGGAGERTKFVQTRDEATGRAWDLTATRIDDGTNTRFILLIRNVTALVRMQDSVRQAQQMAAIGSLAAGVAHQVRNPLFAILANTDALGAVLGGSADADELLAAVRSEVKRVNTLMSDLLTYGRPPATETKPVPVSAVLELAVRYCSPLAREKGIVVCHEGTASDMIVMASRERLAEAFENLIENAIQHSPAESEVAVTVTEVEREDRPWVRVAIRDHGPGFQPEDVSRLFEPFFTRRKGGTGLGLSIAEKVVVQHGGRIRAASAQGGGAELIVELPCLPGTEPQP